VAARARRHTGHVHRLAREARRWRHHAARRIQKFDVYLLDASLPTRTAASSPSSSKVTKLQRAMIGANSLVDELTTRTQALLRATEETPSAPAKLATDIRTIEKDLRDMRETHNGDPTMNRRQEPSRPSLMGRLNTLAQGGRSIDAPTAHSSTV
jgi:hypothetical protein